MNERQALLDAIGQPVSTSGRAWQRMLSGRRLDLLNPEAKDIEIEDIAHGLSRVARWNGQTVGDHAFSVAEHSLLVTDIVLLISPDARSDLQLAALLHDAPEYVIGDLISPFKAAIGADYKLFEKKILNAIYLRFGLVGVITEHDQLLIKQADAIAAYFEAIELAGFSEEEAQQYFTGPYKDFPNLEWRRIRLEGHGVKDAQRYFLERFQALYHH